MDAIARVLHGSYAYLLIFQILLVASLALVALSLIVRRLKFSLAGAGEIPTASLAEVAEVRSQMEGFRIERDALIEKISGLESSKDEAATAGPLAEQNRGLNEKVKFLESKLLEYEILQEEIGALSVIKVENEKLKKRVYELEKPGSAPPKRAIPEQTEVIAAAANAVSEGAATEATQAAQIGSGSTVAGRQAEIDSLLSELGDIGKP